MYNEFIFINNNLFTQQHLFTTVRAINCYLLLLKFPFLKFNFTFTLISYDIPFIAETIFYMKYPENIS